MKKIVLIDGNNLLFRSYFATSYTGNLMKNSKGLYTNALYGFVNMINKIIDEEKPEYMAVAFDIGKTFRHEQYKDYKAGRNKTPEELKMQIPVSFTLLEHMGIKTLTCENYEADDIVGTLCKMANEDPNWDATVITSDHDYLQLITDVVEVKLLSQKGFKRYNPSNFKEEYGIDPIKIIDLKALMGDSSDNIPGVAGVGEKTALKLLVEHGSLDGIYKDIDLIKGKLQEKLINDKESAYFSYELATICQNAPIDIKFEDLKYDGEKETLNDFYRELEFYSLMKDHAKKEVTNDVLVEYLTDVKEISLDSNIAYYIECDNDNYHAANIIKMGLYDGKNNFYVDESKIKEVFEYTKNVKKYTYDLKKNINLLNDFNTNTIYDLSIVSSLLDKNSKGDLAVLMNNDGINISFYKELLKDTSKINNAVALKAKYIYDTHDKYIESIKSEDMYELYEEIEFPLISVLAKMEMNGIICSKEILDNLKEEMNSSLVELEKKIYELSGCEFNISSPSQLGEVLFDKLQLPYAKKTATGKYKTGAEVLEKLVGKHPIIECILEYRNLNKIYTTYLEGLSKFIHEDGKIHTIYKQVFTRTGRLSSEAPNLQNIPAREEMGRLVRKAFLPENYEFLSADYSQIELRLLAHISKCDELIDAFKNELDIHSKVAADIYGKDIKDITKNERRTAKAVIFGIVYGISGFGLSENIGVSPKEAKEFINKYYELYPGVKTYMDMIVASAKECGYVTTLYKRKRYIDELFNTNFMVRQSGERMALNTPIQGTSADIIKKAMIEIDAAFEKNNIKSKMLLQIHDELVFDVVKEEKEKVTKIVKDIMENVVSLSVPLKVSSDFGNDLYETK